jgi:hypothetical protein
LPHQYIAIYPEDKYINPGIKMLNVASGVLMLVSILLAGHANPAEAAHVDRCGGQYDSRHLFWRTVEPSADEVLARLPVAKRQVSGNILSLNYAVDEAGRLVNRAEFNRQWRYIFGKDTKTGYGRLLRGNWAPGAESSLGNSTRINRRNLSECVVDGWMPAICLGIPTSPIGSSNLGQHTGWKIFDKDSPDPNALSRLGVGDRACLTYRMMVSRNFDFSKASNVKFPGLASAPEGSLPPNDHICENGARTINRGRSFSTRIVLGGGRQTTTSGRIFNHFKDDMLTLDCARFRVLNEMHAMDPRTDDLARGVWYRVEHELKLNGSFVASPGQPSGAFSRIWIFDERTGALVTSFEKKDSFRFEGVDYPLMPRGTPDLRIDGMFVSMQYSSSTGDTRGFATAVRGFELYLR